MFAIEEIPNEDFVYIRVHKDFVDSANELPKSTAFVNTPKDGPDLSSDWNKYSTPEDTRNRVRAFIHKKTGLPKDPLNYFVYSFNVMKLRTLDNFNQIVNHSPIFDNPIIPDNQSHASIIGSKPINIAEFSYKMQKAGQWVIYN